MLQDTIWSRVNVLGELQGKKKEEQWKYLEYKVFGKLSFEPQPLMFPLQLDRASGRKCLLFDRLLDGAADSRVCP